MTEMYKSNAYAIKKMLIGSQYRRVNITDVDSYGYTSSIAPVIQLRVLFVNIDHKHTHMPL